jgi:phosphatidylserine/phosphatidylglycerophosphate/cardiolipin synthase-like enzyme
MLLAIVLAATVARAQELRLDCDAAVYFSPRGGTTAALVREIDRAQHSIHVLGYSFTTQPIIAALRSAAARGVVVQIVLDKGQDSPRYAALRQNLTVRIDRRHAIAHNKVMIFDSATVALGSFNYTKGAEERNAENKLIARCPNLAAVYLANWELHHGHSEEPRAGRVEMTIGGGR